MSTGGLGEQYERERRVAPYRRVDLEPATFTLAEFAKLLGVSYSTAQLAAQSGQLPVEGIRVGQKYLFPRSAVRAVLGMVED